MSQQQYDNTNRGVLFKNDRKDHESQPAYRGSINVDGVEFWLSAWIKDGQKGKFMSLSVTPKEPAKAPAPAPQRTHGQMRQEARGSARPQSATGFDDMPDDIPFSNPYRGRFSYVV